MSLAAAQLLGGVMLLCALALVGQPRLAAMIRLVQVQAAALGLAAICQGFLQGADDLYLTGLITLGLNAVALPIALRRLAGRYGLNAAAGPVVPAAVALVLGVALIGVAVVVVVPTTRGDLAFCLSVILLGLLVMTTRRHPMAQALGLLCTANGLLLAAIGMAGMPFVAALAVALLVLVGFAVMVFAPVDIGQGL